MSGPYPPRRRTLGGRGGALTAAAAWTPARLPGAAFSLLSWRPDLATYVSTTHLSALKDAGASGLTLTQATDSKRPVLDTSVTLAGHSSLQITNAASNAISISSGGVTGAHAATVAAVVQVDESPNGYHMIACFGAVGVSGENFGVGTANPSAGAAGWWAGGFGHVACVGGVDAIPAGGYTVNGTNDPCVPLDHAAHYIVAITDGSVTRLYVDGYLAIAPPTSGTGSGAPIADGGYNLVAGFGLQSYAAPGFTTSSHSWEVDFNTTALTAAQRRQTDGYVKASYVAKAGDTATLGYAFAFKPQVVCAIDSLSFGTGATFGTSDYPTQMGPLLSKSCTVWNLGIPGRLLATAQTNVEPDIAGHTTGFAPSNTVVALAGTNEMINNYATAGYAVTLYAALVVYWQAIKVQSPGCKVVACTLIHANPAGSSFVTPATYNPQIDALNALIRAGWSTYCDGLADLGADPTKLAFFTDGLHQTAGTGVGTAAATGYAMFATVVAAAVNTLI